MLMRRVKYVIAAGQTWEVSVDGRSAQRSRRAPSGAVWSFALPHYAFEANFRSLSASKVTRNEAASTGTTWQFSERHVVYNTASIAVSAVASTLLISRDSAAIRRLNSTASSRTT